MYLSISLNKYLGEWVSDGNEQTSGKIGSFLLHKKLIYSKEQSHKTNKCIAIMNTERQSRQLNTPIEQY